MFKRISTWVREKRATLSYFDGSRFLQDFICGTGSQRFWIIYTILVWFTVFWHGHFTGSLALWLALTPFFLGNGIYVWCKREQGWTEFNYPPAGWGRCATCGAAPLPIGVTDCGGHK